ncbi:hypothetical protein MP228_005073 [Amoeboaphelidium protococcarum]|nr:hypothetical protein MP228_005073 [Amoeboaphelidium protococcarum]
MSLMPITQPDLDVWNRLNSLLERMERPVIEGALGSRELLPSERPLGQMDVVEYEKNFVVQTELPGIPKDAIHIELTEGRLRIFGENTLSKDEQQGKWHVQERSYGKFERTLMVPKNADVDNISANYENGVLEVTIPKKTEGLPQKKAISVN